MFRSVKTRTIVAFLGIVALTIIIATIAAFNVANAQERALADSEGVEASEACALIVGLSIEDLNDFKPGAEDYEYCREALKTLCKNAGMTYMYAYTLDPETNTMTYLVTVGGNDTQDAFIQKERPYGTAVVGDIDAIELDALAGKHTSQAIEYDNQFGHMLDWVALVDQKNHILAAASYSISQQRSNVFVSTVTAMVPFVAVMLLLLAIQLFILQRHVMKPLDVISERMKSFSADQARSYKHIGLKSHDELEQISNAFDGMVDEIANYLEDIETMTAAKVQSDVEMNVANRIQQGMVPASTSIAGASADVFAFSRPAREIGGDFYDIVEMDDGALSIIIGDVSGKGVAAALFMAMSKEMIRIELSIGRGPAETLRLLNERLCGRNPEGMFITAFIATLKADGSVVFANAGHLPPIRISDKAETVSCMPGCLLGLFDDAEFNDEHLELAPGEALLLYTDGASEAVNANREFLGVEAIIDTLSSNAPFNSIDDVVGELVGVVDGFAAQAEQFDDLTAIAIMRHGDAGAAKVADKTAPVKALDVALSSFDMVKQDIMNGNEKAARLKACLACEEAFANIVSYSGASHVFYDVSEKEGRLIVVLEDDGVPFDPLMAKPIERDFEELDNGGMGIALVKGIASELSYQRSGGRNVLTLAFDLHKEDEE